MSAPVRQRLFLNFLAVVVAGMGLAAALTWRAVEQAYQATQAENLLAQARLAAATLEGAVLPATPAETYTQTANIQPGIHSRILSEQGAVVIGLPLAASNTPLQAPAAEDNAQLTASELQQREEIQLALQGTPATAVRRLPALGNRRVLYAAAPIRSAAGGITGIVYIATPLPPAGIPPSLAWKLAGALLAAVLLASLTATLLAQRIARPLEKAARAALAVSAGDLDQQITDESGIQEVGQLSQAFNAMTANLKQAERVRNAFISDVTHELRTPLTVIKGTLETLEDGALDDLAGRGSLLASMQRETERLIRLVNDLLLLTRADAGALGLTIAPLDLAELAQHRCDYLARLAAQRQVTLQVSSDASPGSLCILGDEDRLAQVLDNVLDNAIRYAPAGTTITVRIQPKNGDIECAVSDQGPGIASEHLALIFERFYRVDASRNRSGGGAGLGLAIARALVQAQGGHITARSEIGHGTVITFTLPCSSSSLRS